MAPDSAGTNVFPGNVAGSMSPRGVRGVLGPREAEALSGAMIFAEIGAREKRENGRGEGDRSAPEALFGARDGLTQSIFMLLI